MRYIYAFDLYTKLSGLDAFNLCIILLKMMFFSYFSGGATLEFEVELLKLSRKSYFSTPQMTGFTTALLVVGVAVFAVYELYKRASKQGVELKSSKKREKEARRNSGKGNRKKQ